MCKPRRLRESLKKAEWAGKPNSVPQDRSRGGDHFSGPTIARRLKRPTRGVVRDGPPRAAATPISFRRSRPHSSIEIDNRRLSSLRTRRLHGLAGGGVCRAATVAGRAVRSYRTVSPLPVMPSREPAPIGGLISVALSLASPPVAVSHHRARTSSDFPPEALSRPGRPPGPLCLEAL